jgi:yopX protein
VKTICQCTGLKDKNGTLIWENDIVNGSIKRGAAFYRCLVLWNECKARFDVRAQGCNFPMTLDECTDDISMSGFEYEVVGNKFDNPELLEE